MCECCEEIEFWKSQDNEKVEHKIFACIKQYGWRKGQRKVKGQQCSTITSGTYTLNYCPRCGKKL